MKIDELLTLLKRVKKAKGNIEVQCTSFCGTNNGHVCFDIKPDEEDCEVDDIINGHGALCLSIEISDYTRQQILIGIKAMEAQGETYYRSQFVNHNKGERVTPGLSPCAWHNLW